MHELAQARDLLNQALIKAQELGLKRITGITFVVGKGSGIDKDFLNHSLVDHILPQTLAEGCRLEYIEAQVQLQCKSCHVLIDGDNPGFNLGCPQCGSSSIDIIKGDSVYISSIEGE